MFRGLQSQPNETKSEEALRLRGWLGKKAPYYCRPHGFRIIVFIDGIGGCKSCCVNLIDKLQDRARARLVIPENNA